MMEKSSGHHQQFLNHPVKSMSNFSRLMNKHVSLNSEAGHLTDFRFVAQPHDFFDTTQSAFKLEKITHINVFI